MIYTAEDDDAASDASSLVSCEDDGQNNHPNSLVTAISRLISASSSSLSTVTPPNSSQNASRPTSVSESGSLTPAHSISLPTSPSSGVSQSIPEREAAYLAKACRPNEFSSQAIAFARQLLLPHLNSYPVHRRISLLTDITCGCKDFSRLEHELPFAILETVNDAFDSTSVAALSPSLVLLSQALRYNTKAFALSGAFPLLGLILAKLFLIFKDDKVFEQLVEISDIVVKRWILADMKGNLAPFLQSFITACGRFWPSQPPHSAQELMRTLINGCHSIVSIQALFDCARGQVAIGDDPSVAILGALSAIRHFLLETTCNSPATRSISPTVESSSAVSDTGAYTRKLISETALPLVSNLMTNNRGYCRQPKVFLETTELLLTVVTNSHSPLLKGDNDSDSDFWTVMVHCIEALDLTIHELSLNIGSSTSSAAGTTIIRSSSSGLSATANAAECVAKYNALLLAIMEYLEKDSPHFKGLYLALSNVHSSSALRSVDVIPQLICYFCNHRLPKLDSDETLGVFVELQNFVATFYVRESRQSVRECVVAGLSSAFIAKPELISEMVVTVIIDTIFAGSATTKPRPIISDTSSPKYAQAALAFIKQLFHATRPARNRHFFISQALSILSTVANGGSITLIETLSRDIFGIVVANMIESITCTGPVLTKAVETIGGDLLRRFETGPSAQEVLICWRPTLLRLLCLCSALDANSLGYIIIDRRFVEASCSCAKIDDLLELLKSTPNQILRSDCRDVLLLPGLRWTAETSVTMLSFKLLVFIIKTEKDPTAFKCFACIAGRFFSKRRILRHFATPGLYSLVNELVELFCKCAATSIKRYHEQQQQLQQQLKEQQLREQSQQQMQQQQNLQQPTQTQLPREKIVGAVEHQHQPQAQLPAQQSQPGSVTASPQVQPTQQTSVVQPSPYCLATIFRTFLLVPALDFALEEERRCIFFRCVLKTLKSPVAAEAMDCLTLSLAHMSTKHAQEWLERVTVELSKLVSSTTFAPNVILLMDTLRTFIKRAAITISQNSFLAIFSLVLSFANPGRFGFFYSSLAFNSMFAWYLDSPVHLRPDLGSYVLKQLSGYRTFSENSTSISSSGVKYYDEMTDLTRDVVTEHNSRRSNDFEPSRLTEFESAPTWFLDNDRLVSFIRDAANKGEGSVSVLVRSPSSVSIFSLQRTTPRHRTTPRNQDPDAFDNEIVSLVSTFFGSSAALSLRKPPTTEAERGLKILDLILPFQKFKFGILFCGPGQSTEEAILSNCYGTPRYERFIEKLGRISSLVSDGRITDSQFLYTGGLATGGEDGRVALTYVDDYCQVAYHVATLMPNHIGDPKRNSKKRHIGNDFVIIIYNGSGSTPQRGGVASVISGSFAYATIVITPLLDGNSLVQLFGKHDVPGQLRWNDGKTMIVPERLLPDFVRLLAMHADITARCVSETQPVAFNWLERLRHIRRLRAKLSQMSGSVADDTTSEVVYQ